MTQRADRITALFLLISVVEGIVVAVILLFIPTDPKNAFLFGYSKSRLLMLAAVVVLLLLFGAALVNKRLRSWVARLLDPASRFAKILPWVGGLMLLLLWLTIWMPAHRFEESAAGFTRLQPLLIWVELVAVQASLAAWAIGERGSFRSALGDLQGSRKWLRIGVGLAGLTILIFTGLLIAGGEFSGRQLYFPPGAPLSGLQVLLAWVVYYVLLKLEQRSQSKTPPRKWVAIMPFLFIWALTFAAWSSIPIPCTDDRPGPFPPNNVCYPNVNDAVYSIASHYITLGEGVYNQWLTDKPLYMAFLALGQGIAGPMIDDYLGFQVAVIALLPALLFLVGRKLAGSAFGVLLAILASLQGAYAIKLYREVGSVNVKLENPEVLTALFLVLFAIAAFKWLSNPADPRWAILSGGILGLSVLLRFNPLFIIPFLVLAVFLAGKGNYKKVVIAILLSGLAFFLAFGPWFFSATDSSGRNHYFVKIEEVINSRFSSRQDQKLPDSPAGADDPTQIQPLSPAAGYMPENPPSEQQDLLYYGLGEIDKAGISGIFYHFLNNIYTGLAKLPSSLVLHPIQEQVKDGIWTFTDAQPLWKVRLRAENLIAMGINLVLVLIGILTALKRFGLAGLTGLVVQLGYYAGNAISQTSGGRYLEPVFWVLILYYCLGLFSLTTFGIKAFSRALNSELAYLEVNKQPTMKLRGRRYAWQTPALLAAFLLLGMVLPLLNLIPEKLPAETDSAIEATAYTLLAQNGFVSAGEWGAFLKDSNHVIIQGRAYHPRYYRGNFYRPGNLSFELMLLSKDHVLVGYSPRMMPSDSFSDASDVILVGCLIGRDSLWAAQRLIVESIAIIQLDNEGQLYLDKNTAWDCTR